MKEVVELPGIIPYVQANAKLDLGDYYLMSGEVWEATLLYSQVEKAFHNAWSLRQIHGKLKILLHRRPRLDGNQTYKVFRAE